VLLVVGVIVVVLVIGGLTQVSRQSAGYDANSNRTLASLGSVVVYESNATAGEVNTLIGNLPNQSRQVLQEDLDSAVRQTSDDSAKADLAAGNPSPQSLHGQFAEVFAERAQSMENLRAAIDGYLGLHSTPPAGSPDALATTVASSSPTLSAGQASNRISAAGALLRRADAQYDTVRRSLAAAVGHGRLPASVWVSDPQDWQVGTVAATVDLMATSSTLAVTHNLVLRTVRLNPPALPTPQGTAAGIQVISPVTQFGVGVVVANEGSVDEPHATVHLSMANQTTGATKTRTLSTPIALGATVALPTATFGVKPGTTYVLTITIVLPPGQTSALATATQTTVQVAPAT
jgi:hypothetical protein